MVALLALIPVISGLIGGASIGSVFGMLTLTQWFGIAGALSSAEPAVVAAVRALHPVFADLITDVGQHGPTLAAKKTWGSFQPKTIPGYLPDGSLGEVANPDYQARG